MSDAPSLTLLHLSDLHFGQDRGEATARFDQQLVTQALLRDIQAQVKAGLKPDAVLVSGDIAFSGKPEEYIQAEAWLKQVCEATEISPSQLLLVPGNHDVDRKKVAEKKTALRTHQDLRQSPLELDYYLREQDEFQVSLWPKLAAYADFALRLGSPTLSPAQPFWRHSLANPFGKPVVVLGLNSCLLSFDGDDAPKNLALGLGQLEPAFRNIPDDTLVLVLAHHPPEWLVDGLPGGPCKPEHALTTFLQKHPHVLFVGHVHQQGGLVAHPLISGGLLRFVAGAGHEAAHEGGRHAYAWLRIHAEGIDFYPRMWNADGQHFQPEANRFALEKGEAYTRIKRTKLPDKLEKWLERPAVPSDSPPPGPRGRDPLDAACWTKPLKYTLEHTSYIELAGIRRIDGAFRLPLERVFVDLRADRSGPRGRGAGSMTPKDQGRKQSNAKKRHSMELDRTVPLHEALSESARDIFVGDPGSGKTTLLRFVARVISEGLLTPGAPAQRARTLLGLAESDPLPYPLFTTLATLDHYLEERDIPTSKVTGRLMQGFLCSILESAGLHLTLPELEQVIDAKRLLVLLDGFDEIPGHRKRQRAAKGVKELLACCTDLRVLMTSRTRAFEAEVQGELGSLEPWRLQPMSDLELKRFLEVWFGAVHDTEPTKAAQVSAELYQEICQHPEVRRMATTPNVVTLMAILKHNQARLPKRRVELYREVIDLFLELKDVAKGLEDTWKLELGVSFALDEKRDLLAALALEMHGGGDAGRTVAEDVVTECFALQFMRARSGWDEKTSRQKASRLLDLLQLRSGLLRKEEYGVQFSHLGLQEFLAAYALSSEPEEALWQKLEPRLKDAWWNEVIRLLVALKGRQSGPLLRRLANAGQGEAPDWEKAGRGIALALGGLGDLPTLHVSKPDEQEVRSKLDLLVGKGTPVPVSSRIEALLALGRVGDPRLGMDNPERWVWHPPGSFMMGSESGDSDERPIHRVHIRQGFWLGKYPVTVQEYAAFMEANGYQTRAWWSEAGWVYIQEEKRLAPRYWDAAEYSAPNQPVVWMSWHEAEAFCSWQNHRWVEAPPTRLLEGLKHVGSGSPVLRLPSESEWEYAARGEQSRTYPWGDTPEPDHELANFSSMFGRPTPVGAYPQGQSWAGAADLAGNAWEWCQDTYHDSYKGAPADGSAWTTGGDSAHRVIRGGSWWNDSGRLSGAGRDWGRPGAWNRGWGFRVVLASVPGGDHWHSIL